MPDIYVITWSFYDKSSFGVVRSYASLEDAEIDLEMMQKFSDAELKIVAVNFVAAR